MIRIAKKQKSGKKGGRKHGRNAKWCLAYRNRNQRERNKAKRLNKHLRRFPGDNSAIAALRHCGDTVRGFKLAA